LSFANDGGGEAFGARRVAAAFGIVAGLVLMNGPALF
jgi:hypothetical protein